MAIVSALLRSPTRLVAAIRPRALKLANCKRIACLALSFQHCHTSDTNSSAEHLSSGLEKYKDLQIYFNRRLRATHHRFSNIPDYSVVCGHHHVYFIEGDGIYRMDERQRELEHVLNLGQVSGGEEKKGPKNGERMQTFQWTIQRIRLSPQEKHLAATLKANHREELRCVVVKLDRKMSSLDPSHIMLTLDKVFSLEWATDEVLFYTTLEGLRCSRVFRLDLTSSGSRITSVYEEERPDVFVEVALSRDRQILSINCNNRTSSEVLLIDTTAANLEPLLVQPRQLDLLYHVEHWRRCLVILANTGPGQEYEVVQAPLTDPSMASWVSLFVPGPGSAVKDMEVVGDHCVLAGTTPTNELVLTVVPLTHPMKAYTVPLPSWACAIETKKPGLADESKVLEFLLSSPVHPPVPYCLYLEDGLLLSGTEDGSFPVNRGNYTTRRLEACSQMVSCFSSVGPYPGASDTLSCSTCGRFETDATAGPCLWSLWQRSPYGVLPREEAASGAGLDSGLLPHQRGRRVGSVLAKTSSKGREAERSGGPSGLSPTSLLLMCLLSFSHCPYSLQCWGCASGSTVQQTPTHDAGCVPAGSFP
ncbi:prolyl endopeptidase-like isoform X2 [Scophthalmus maximus]|uniref:prolyl endopeptidase-like isoform X2 n=1 Tax=Scophthalmus maximus TaxID=52904 RepID=UPI001FA891E8|nr:prolyl endopeptidase-like isoform X2 [Scophthalmus maximus]